MREPDGVLLKTLSEKGLQPAQVFLFPRDLFKVIPQFHARNEWMGASVWVSSILVEVLFLTVL